MSGTTWPSTRASVVGRGGPGGRGPQAAHRRRSPRRSPAKTTRAEPKRRPWSWASGPSRSSGATSRATGRHPSRSMSGTRRRGPSRRRRRVRAIAAPSAAPHPTVPAARRRPPPRHPRRHPTSSTRPARTSARPDPVAALIERPAAWRYPLLRMRELRGTSSCAGWRSSACACSRSSTGWGSGSSSWSQAPEPRYAAIGDPAGRAHRGGRPG